MKKYISIIAAVGVLLALTGCGDAPPTVSDPVTTTTTTTAENASTTTLPQNEGLDTLTFVGQVLETVEDGSAVLMECVEECPLGDTVWVQLGNLPDIQPQVGATYTVTYEDMVMLSLPPRVNAVAMVAAGSDSSATETTAAAESVTTTTESIVDVTDPTTSAIQTSATTVSIAAPPSSAADTVAVTTKATTKATTKTTGKTATTTVATTVTTTIQTAATTAIATPPPPLESLDAAVAWDIRKAMINMDPEIPDQYTAEDVQLTYYGTYNDYVVVSIFAPFLAADDVRWDETVGGQTFANVCAYDLYMWRHGEFFMLRDVYKKGWITDAQLRDLAYYWNGNHGKAMK